MSGEQVLCTNGLTSSVSAPAARWFVSTIYVPKLPTRTQRAEAAIWPPQAEYATDGGAAANVAVDLEKIAYGVRLILEGIGDDPARPGLLDTPSRVARMYAEMLYGTNCNPSQELATIFHEDTEELVLVRDINFASLCEHHLLPFVGVAHVGYIPKSGKITGLSKLARVVESASKRLQVQERMTAQIADAIVETLDPHGVVVIAEAEHFCMSVRGIKQPHARTMTSAVRGSIATNAATRAEVMSLITRK